MGGAMVARILEVDGLRSVGGRRCVVGNGWW